MVLELRIVGPGLDVSRRLAPGEPALILGRDADCPVCLPDPGRNVSRRHLSLWNEGGQLHFHVLSVVNGVEVAGHELPPGARGVLQPGEPLALAAYRIAVEEVAQEDPTADPWALLEQEAAAAAVALQPSPTEDDPFGDGGFASTFGPGAPGGALEADALAPATDLRPFLRGLGLDDSRIAAFTRGELETLGRATRLALLGVLQASQAAGQAREDLRAEDRTMAHTHGANPLRLDTPLEARLQYLFGGGAGVAGFAPPDRAVAEVVADLLAHQEALRLAARAAVEGAFQEFEPEALRTRLLGGGARLFESARAWDAFVKDYAQRREELPAWVQQVLERHFAAAYVREYARIKRDTGPRRR